jgi:chromosome partitioning protein
VIISIASQKGGTGKTSTSISLAAGLARRAKKVLLIDVDSQANSSKVLLPDYSDIHKEETLFATILQRQPLPVRPTGLPHLDLVPAHILLSDTDIELTTAIDHREARLKIQLDKIPHRYDFILFDCPRSLSWLTINALTASDSVMVIVSPSYFELDSIVQISKTIQQVQENFNPHLQLLGYLFTIPKPRQYANPSIPLCVAEN